jgi:hypothetical protein
MYCRPAWLTPDHLEFNLFPRLGRGPYPNAGEWARDIYHPDRSPIREQLRVPKTVRLWWGALKNLLSGVTTVCHHNPYEREVFGAAFRCTVRRFSRAHCRVRRGPARARPQGALPLSLPGPLRRRFRRRCPARIAPSTRWGPSTPHRDHPRRRHHALRLELMRAARRRWSGVHLEPGRCSHRVACRTSFRHSDRLATDSALSAPVDLLDELRVARKHLAPARLYELVTWRSGAHSASSRVAPVEIGSQSARQPVLPRMPCSMGRSRWWW